MSNHRKQFAAYLGQLSKALHDPSSMRYDERLAGEVDTLAQMVESRDFARTQEAREHAVYMHNTLIPELRSAGDYSRVGDFVTGLTLWRKHSGAGPNWNRRA